jgi:hypothetical protein
MRGALLALLLLAPIACDGDKKPPAPTPKKEADDSLVGTWVLQFEAVREMILKQTKNDMVSEGMDVKKLNEKQLAAVTKSAQGCTRTIVLAADGTFTSNLGRDVPGEQFKEQSSGTWEASGEKVILTVEHIEGEPQEPPEVEELVRHEHILMVHYYDHPLPMVRKEDR